MRFRFNSVRAALGFSAMALVATPAAAQEPTAAAEPDAVTSSQEIVVQGRIAYRNRTESVAPVLEYGLDYFQRFEPISAGDALKRVPSVAFLSDVTEADGVRLRGLDTAYTQILVNGEEVPGSGAGSGGFGSGADTAFFVDRIPAELIERVEIVRSSSANRSGDAVAGAINIVLRDGFSLDGGFVRAGTIYTANDGKFGETVGGVWGGELLGGRLLVGANMQDRFNPKDKFSDRLRQIPDEDPAPRSELGRFNIEDQTDVRDSTDYSANFAYETKIGPGELKLDGFFVQTDRFENEDSIEYANPAVLPQVSVQQVQQSPSVESLRTAQSLTTVNDNNVDIEQQSWSLNGGYEFPMLGGETRVKLGYARIDNEESEFEDETEFRRDANVFPEADRYTGELAALDVEDTETTFKLEHKRPIGQLELEVGVHVRNKERDTIAASTSDETRVRLTTSGVVNNTFFRTARPPSLGPVDPRRLRANPVNITRDRIDPYVMLSDTEGSIRWEAGLRYETSDTDISVLNRYDFLESQDIAAPFTTSRSSSSEELLPSASVRWSLTPVDRITASAARTIRRPSFELLNPSLLAAELGDNDFVGNPGLTNETAWGVDVGYERALPNRGVVGVNVFYRDISDLIEFNNTGVEGSEGPGTFVYSARNTGSGEVYGIEFDLSTPLSFIGLDHTGLFLNYSYLDSEVTDEFGSRRFNDQAESILNVGFIQDLPRFGAAFGASYRKQGDAESRYVTEEIFTQYGADLEAFIEKRIGESFTVRLTGSNLLDESKDEQFNKFDTIGQQRARTLTEFESESETSGPYFQLIGRYAF